MIVRSMSGIDRQASSCNYVVLPPGMPLVATTPARTPCCANASPAVGEQGIITSGALASVFVFFIWVGAWGALDTIILMVTTEPLHQLAIYSSVLLLGLIGVWVQVKDWRKAQEEIQEGFRV